MRTDEKPYFDPKKRIPNFEEVAHFCSSLVEVAPVLDMVFFKKAGRFKRLTSQYGVVQLAHSSVKTLLTPNYLDTRWASCFESATVQASVAKNCLCYTVGLGKYCVSNRRDSASKFPFERVQCTNLDVSCSRCGGYRPYPG